MSIQVVNGIRVSTSQPDPYSSDWYAIDDNTYDADCDQDGFFSLSPMGIGKTEAEAIQDLLDQIEEQEDGHA